jgi:hypothetical protein
MKQIYYTQCPIGYGLGASNGFQIKRLSPGYPVSGDFRHFSLRAFVGGTRLLAPPTLRYRRGEGGVAEVAWLTPRSHEYETERGPWGRPGGHFAHGLQLDDDELRALGDWPAGLFGRPFWTRTDREPSRGQPPPPLELSADDLARPPTFEAVAPMAEGEDADRLARLLTALAASLREGRTLFLIDEPARLAERVALLTFAFPEPWRAALTFSTYHDRPDELPGFRLQGTIPAARPNRPALLAQGFVADLAAAPGTIEPRVEPVAWARTLAGWLVRRAPDDQADWEATRRRALRVRLPAVAGPEALWADDWLERLIGMPGMVRGSSPVPVGDREWSDLAGWTAWAGRAGLADEWVVARPPDWWRSAAVGAAGPEARAALREHLGLPESWRGAAQATAWGEVVARWVEAMPPDDPGRLETIARGLTAPPDASRPSFAVALIRRLPADAAAATLRWLEGQTSWDRGLLLPLKVHGAVASGDPHALQALLAQALAQPGALTAVLDAVAAEVCESRDARAVVAGQLALALGNADPRGMAEVQRWALGRGQEEAVAWLGPYWERLFADPLNQDTWNERFRLTPAESRASLTRVVLGVAIGPRAPAEAFRWGIEELVLPLHESGRPHDAAWPGAYVDRLPSGLDLLKRLFAKEYGPLLIHRWLDRARDRGELSEAQAARIDDCVRYARVLMSGDARALLEVRLPDVPAGERGVLLGQMLKRLGDGSDESLNLALDSCRAAWPDGFRPGAAGLDGLAEALAGPLSAGRAYPDVWLERLGGVLRRLGLDAAPGQGYEPDGLAAEVAAATNHRPGEGFDPWRLRHFILQHDDAWRILAADVRHDLGGQPVERSLKLLETWDQKLAKGKHTARFFEIWMNSCKDSKLSAAVIARAADLKGLDLAWWDSPRCDGATDDLRERFVRLVPMAPLCFWDLARLREGVLTRVRRWLFPTTPRPPQTLQTGADLDELVPLDPEGPVPGPAPSPIDGSRRAAPISARGLIRWRCIEALTLFAHPDETAESRRQRLDAWIGDLPLGELDLDDRRRFVGWVIFGIPRLDPDRIERLARWLSRSGFNDPKDDWLGRWYEDLTEGGSADVDGALQLERAAMVGELRSVLRGLIGGAAPRGRKTGIAGSP